MRRAEAMAALLPVAVDAEQGEPLHRQVYRELARLILAGRIAAGSRLPSSRELARELGVARNTVLAALDQLTSEGYVEGRRGSGTYVATDLPDAPPLAPEGSMARAAARALLRPPLAPRASMLADGRYAPARLTGLLAPGSTDPGEFPFELWARLLAKSWRRPSQSLAAGGSPAGYLPLRQAIADYLRLLRGVRCEAEQVIIVSGSRNGLDLAARLLLSPGDAVWLEDPGYPGLRGPLAAAGAKLVPVPVDDEGIDITMAPRGSRPRLIVVSPSHHYPLGMTMSLPRRLQLLERARQSDAWILEDDYDSEWRYRGRPLAALQGLDADGRVIYAGILLQGPVRQSSRRLSRGSAPGSGCLPQRARHAGRSAEPDRAAGPGGVPGRGTFRRVSAAPAAHLPGPPGTGAGGDAASISRACCMCRPIPAGCIWWDSQPLN